MTVLPAPDAEPETLDWRRPWPAARLAGWGAATAVAMAALTVLVVTENSILLSIDEAISDFTRSWADELGWPVTVSDVIGEATNPRYSTLYLGAAFLALLVFRKWRWALYLAATAGVGVIITEIIKVNVGRERPPTAAGYEDDLFKSFPSGHTSSGLYIYAMFGVMLILLGLSQDKRWIVYLGNTLAIFGVLLGLTRLVLGVHWPSDVVGGWLLGSAVLLLSSLAIRPERQVRPWARPPLPPAPPPQAAADEQEFGHS